MRGQLVPQEGEGANDPQARVGVADESALFANADRREPEAGRRDAGGHARVLGAHIAAIFDQTGLRVSLFPEKKETRLFQIVEQLVVFRSNRARSTRHRLTLQTLAGPTVLRVLVQVGVRAHIGESGQACQRPRQGKATELAQHPPSRYSPRAAQFAPAA